MSLSKISLYLKIISLASLITIFVMIVNRSYDSLMAPINKSKTDLIIKPINPVIDPQVLTSLEKKTEFFESDKISSSSPVPTLSATFHP